MNECQLVTSCIVHLADSANFEGVTSIKLFSGLTGSCFESPNDTIHVTVVKHLARSRIIRLSNVIMTARKKTETILTSII
jgi:hypothetical protein